MEEAQMMIAPMMAKKKEDLGFMEKPKNKRSRTKEECTKIK
jgi:hypothetical protein